MHGDLVSEYLGKNLAAVRELTSVSIFSLIKGVCGESMHENGSSHYIKGGL
jgi:hypothetical protein